MKNRGGTGKKVAGKPNRREMRIIFTIVRNNQQKKVWSVNWEK